MIYGLATGLSHSWQQGLSTAVKMPVLFLATLAFTLPALSFFALALLNVSFSVAQAGVVVLSGIGVSSFLLLGLVPVTFFFVFTSTNYTFFQLLAVVFVAISGFTGLYYSLKGFRYVDIAGVNGNFKPKCGLTPRSQNTFRVLLGKMMDRHLDRVHRTSVGESPHFREMTLHGSVW